MKILFISGAGRPDYQCDCLAHGLISLGHDVTDIHRLSYLYDTLTPEQKAKLYGRGFSLYGLLSEPEVDRGDIERKIQLKYFDLVVFGSIQRNQQYLPQVLEYTPVAKIVFIDGEDHVGILSGLLGRGIYFKRELVSANLGLHPIHFAIPKEKIGTIASQKQKAMAFIDPRDPGTYIYTDEKKYYTDYAESLFAVTKKKGGWDCMRHYEIMANGCIPYFLGLENCPREIMTGFPKCEVLHASNVVRDLGVDWFLSEAGQKLWHALNSRIQAIFQKNCTTVALADYVLRTVRGE